jgi:methylase of polypeptide subunit release factors
VAKNGETSPAEFVRWYLATYQDILDALAGTRVEGVSKQEMAARILNALLFLGFARAVSSARDGQGIERLIDAPLLDAVISKDAMRKCPVAILSRVASAIDRFGFSLVDVDLDPTSRVVSPGMLDEASEALARSLAGEEKIASRGTFYTQHAEISFMCKVVVSRFLQDRLPLIPRRNVEALVFGIQPMGGNQKTDALVKEGEARQIIDALLSLKALDPACGSGAFLTGMVTTCHDIISRLAATNHSLATDPGLLARKLIMIVNGVDSDALAVQVAKIRVYLWYINNARIRDVPLESIDLPVIDNNVVQADFFWYHPSCDARSFDVVIGNPPYVRQEDIKPSRNTGSLPTRDEKDRYKEALLDVLKKGSPRASHFSRTCDLYVYFFIKAVQVLRDGGELCYITSNTWLDAKFGRELHDFLLETTSSLSIFDFSERSFGRAEINTVITACTRHDAAIGKNPHVSFAHFKIPPERVMSIPSLPEPDIAGGIAHDHTGTHTAEAGLPRHVSDSIEARLVVVNRDELVSAGRSSGNAVGGKWRVKYLNEHDIFYAVLRKAAGKLVSLGSIASVKAGCYSGINDFFYVDSQTIDRFGIEAQYIRPLLWNARAARILAMPVPEGSFIVAIPPVSKGELEHRGHGGIASYITWGESQRTKRGQKTATGIPWPRVESVRHRAYWYSLSPGNLYPARLLMQYIAHDRFYCPWSVEPVVPDRCFHRVGPLAGIDLDVMAAVLNSTFQAFMVMVTGRAGLGGGALKLEAIDAKSMPVLDPRLLSQAVAREMTRAIKVLGRRGPVSLSEECGLDPSKPYPGQSPSPLPDRATLDKVVFDVLGLTDDERDQVYRATCLAIARRLKKARSAR